jgi:hypothetical protein
MKVYLKREPTPGDIRQHWRSIGGAAFVSWGNSNKAIKSVIQIIFLFFSILSPFTKKLEIRTMGNWNYKVKWLFW